MSESQLPTNIKAFLDNSMRLLDDAELLRKHERYSSAFVLAVISLEEVGKAVLEFWRRDGKSISTKGRSAHLQKQAAVACMVLAGEFVPDLKAIALADDDDEEALNRVAKDGYTTDSMLRMINVEKRLLDKAKQAGLYQDDDGSEVLQMQHFTLEQVNEVAEQSFLALKGIPDALTRDLAHRFFEVNREVFLAEGRVG